MSETARFSTPRSPAECLFAIQSAVGAFGGTITAAADTDIRVALSPYARAELLQTLYGSHEPEELRSGISITVQIAPGAPTTLIFTASTPYWFVQELGILASTLDSFMMTVSGGLTALAEGRRPPDSPAPPR